MDALQHVQVLHKAPLVQGAIEAAKVVAMVRHLAHHVPIVHQPVKQALLVAEVETVALVVVGLVAVIVIVLAEENAPLLVMMDAVLNVIM